MNKELFETLLFEEESTTLDFKIGQYKFVGASQIEKSELLKDILGFSNAWRRSEAYILIGVEEVVGGQSEVVGIEKSQHLDDHSLQQFVNAKSNTPINFHYSAFNYEGKQVGIFKIEEQNRPVYLKADYGKLKKNEVYVRRGSSTDPTKPALPEEISRMGVKEKSSDAELTLELLGHGKEANLNSQFLNLPDRTILPDYSDGSTSNFNALTYCNYNYYRDFAEFLLSQNFFKSLKFLIKNSGESPAQNVRVEVTFKRKNCIVVENIDKIEMPETKSFPSSQFKSIKSVFHKNPGDIDLHENEDNYFIEIDIGDLQPGRSINSEEIYLGMRISGSCRISCSIFSDSLSEPIKCELITFFKVDEVDVSIQDVMDKANSRAEYL